jgi:sugar lactone lactonase YvrE
VTRDTPIDYSETLNTVLALNFDLAEGPIWDAATNTLVFVDCHLGHINQLEPAKNLLTTLETGQTIGVALPCKSDGFVATSASGLLYCDKQAGTSLLVPVEAGLPGNRMNDGKCDSRGRLWSGTFSTDFKRDAGSLYRIDPDLSLTRAVSGIRVSNGLAWNEDETLMYFNDTLSRAIDVFDYDIEHGTLANRRRFVDIDRQEGLPDGMTVDAEGHVWVALFFGSQVRRYSPEGKLVGVVQLPAARVTSCNFGGEDLQDLYVTTANFSLHDDGHLHEAKAGHVFKCRPGVRGLPSYPFGR